MTARIYIHTAGPVYDLKRYPMPFVCLRVRSASSQALQLYFISSFVVTSNHHPYLAVDKKALVPSKFWDFHAL